MNIIEVLVPAQEIVATVGSSIFLLHGVRLTRVRFCFWFAWCLKIQLQSSISGSSRACDGNRRDCWAVSPHWRRHQPGRAWHFYAHITPWSWMSLGSLFLLPLFFWSGCCDGLDLPAWWHRWLKSENPLLKRLSWPTLGQWQVSKKGSGALAAGTAFASGLSIALLTTGAEIAAFGEPPGFGINRLLVALTQRHSLLQRA